MDVESPTTHLGLSVDALKATQDTPAAVIQGWTADVTGYVADVDRDKKDMLTRIEGLKAAVAGSGSGGATRTDQGDIGEECMVGT